jgi:hypothetical protein
MASITCSLLQSSASLTACCPCKRIRAPRCNDLSRMPSAFSRAGERSSSAALLRSVDSLGHPHRIRGPAVRRTRCQASDRVSDEMHISRRDACLGVLGAALAASVQPLGEANAREIEVRSSRCCIVEWPLQRALQCRIHRSCCLREDLLQKESVFE